MTGVTTIPVIHCPLVFLETETGFGDSGGWTKRLGGSKKGMIIPT